MNIQRAKDEIKNSVRAYLARDARGEYMIPTVHQRPILLIGPPGIGKTAIMEQVARECQVAMVSYTITHHTRQSAVGLPYIEKDFFAEKPVQITEYTMSEIIAEVYHKMRETGLNEGILFIDEINCVSETLAPTMLQFLQCKSFGNHKIPEGWVIVAAGNPPEYNKSVREFDVVTLDRVKRINVDADYEAFKQYAYKTQLHGAVISYLELKKNNFYDVKTTIDGKIFVTARGWEDLSRMMKAYESLNIKIDAEFIGEYLQHPEIAMDFANYYDLYNKYKSEYGISEIIEGNASESIYEKAMLAPYDERYSLISHILSGLSTYFSDAFYKGCYITELFDLLKEVKKIHDMSAENLRADMSSVMEKAKDKAQSQVAAGILGGDELVAFRNAIETLNRLSLLYDFSDVQQAFEEEKGILQELLRTVTRVLDNAFEFILKAFGEGQELVAFVTELSLNAHAIKFLSEVGNNNYQMYCAKYLSSSRQREIQEEIDIQRASQQV